MPCNEFTAETIHPRLGLTIARRALFPFAAAVPAPPWLTDILARGERLVPARSEKARSEVIIAPILMAAADASSPPLALFSGEQFDVDAARGLNGEVDHLFARSPSATFIEAPVLAVVEAKKLDINAGLGQCVAQMEAARSFNQKAGTDVTVFGCVTTGELWQFLRHDVTSVVLDTRRYAVQ